MEKRVLVPRARKNCDDRTTKKKLPSFFEDPPYPLKTFPRFEKLPRFEFG